VAPSVAHAAKPEAGPGIAPAHLPHIFNPFYTTTPRGFGTGLGLSSADGIIKERGGHSAGAPTSASFVK
jgi:signal transduction histidine kinase